MARRKTEAELTVELFNPNTSDKRLSQVRRLLKKYGWK